MGKDNQFLGNVKAVASNIIGCINSINILDAEYNALDIGNTLGDEALAAAGITRNEFTTAISSFRAIRSLFESGHNTNLYKVK